MIQYSFIGNKCLKVKTVRRIPTIRIVFGSTFDCRNGMEAISESLGYPL